MDNIGSQRRATRSPKGKGETRKIGSIKEKKQIEGPYKREKEKKEES